MKTVTAINYDFSKQIANMKKVKTAIKVGLDFKRMEKSEGGVTANTIHYYKMANEAMNGLSDSDKDFVNSEVRRLNK